MSKTSMAAVAMIVASLSIGTAYAHPQLQSTEPAARAVTLSGRPVAVTPAEFRLLAALAERPGRTYTRAELVVRVAVTVALRHRSQS